jgi:hypothetical protein
MSRSPAGPHIVKDQQRTLAARQREMASTSSAGATAPAPSCGTSSRAALEGPARHPWPTTRVGEPSLRRGLVALTMRLSGGTQSAQHEIRAMMWADREAAHRSSVILIGFHSDRFNGLLLDEIGFRYIRRSGAARAAAPVLRHPREVAAATGPACCEQRRSRDGCLLFSPYITPALRRPGLSHSK